MEEEKYKVRIEPLITKINTIKQSINKKERERILLQLAYDQLLTELQQIIQGDAPQMKILDKLLKHTNSSQTLPTASKSTQNISFSNNEKKTNQKNSEQNDNSKPEKINQNKNNKNIIPSQQQQQPEKQQQEEKVEQEEEEDPNDEGQNSKINTARSNQKNKKDQEANNTKDNGVNNKNQKIKKTKNEQTENPEKKNNKIKNTQKIQKEKEIVNEQQLNKDKVEQVKQEEKEVVQLMPSQKYNRDIFVYIISYLSWEEQSTLRILNKSFYSLIISHLQSVLYLDEEILEKLKEEERDGVKQEYIQRVNERREIMQSVNQLQNVLSKLNLNEKNVYSSLLTFLQLIGFSVHDSTGIQYIVQNFIHLVQIKFILLDKTAITKNQKTILSKLLKETDLQTLQKQNDVVYVIGKYLFQFYTSSYNSTKNPLSSYVLNYYRAQALQRILRIPKKQEKEVFNSEEEENDDPNTLDNNNEQQIDPLQQQQQLEQQQENNIIEQKPVVIEQKVSSQKVSLDPSVSIQPNSKYTSDIFLQLFDFLRVEDTLKFNCLSKKFFEFFKENNQKLIEFLTQKSKKMLKNNKEIINLMISEGIIQVTKGLISEKIEASGIQFLKGMLNPPEQIEKVVRGFARIIGLKSQDYKVAIKQLSSHNNYLKNLEKFKYFYMQKDDINLMVELRNSGLLKVNQINKMDKTVGYMGLFLLEVINQQQKEENTKVPIQVIRDYWISQQCIYIYNITTNYTKEQSYLRPKNNKNLLENVTDSRIYQLIFDCLDTKLIFDCRVLCKKLNNDILIYVRNNNYKKLIDISISTQLTKEQVEESKENQEKATDLWNESKALLEEINPKDFASLLENSAQKPEIKALLTTIAKFLGMKKTSWEGIQEVFDFAEFVKRAEELDIATLNTNKHFQTGNTFVLENSVQKLSKANLTCRFIALWIHKVFEAARGFPYAELELIHRNQFSKTKIEQLDIILKKYHQ